MATVTCHVCQEPSASMNYRVLGFGIVSEICSAQCLLEEAKRECQRLGFAFCCTCGDPTMDTCHVCEDPTCESCLERDEEDDLVCRACSPEDGEPPF